MYDVAGREAAEDRVSSRDLVAATKARDAERGIRREVLYGGSLDETFSSLDGIIRPDDLVLVVGAGDVYTLAKRLIS